MDTFLDSFGDIVNDDIVGKVAKWSKLSSLSSLEIDVADDDAR